MYDYDLDDDNNIYNNRIWYMTDFNKWDPNDGVEYPVTSLSLNHDFIINKLKLKQALNNLHNLENIQLIGLMDSNLNRIPDKYLFGLIDLDNLPNLRTLIINNQVYSSDGKANTKSIDTLRAEKRRPEETANLLNNIRTKKRGTPMVYDLIPHTMGFIHDGEHIPQSISQKRANISSSSLSSLGGKRKSKKSRKSRRPRKINKRKHSTKRRK